MRVFGRKTVAALIAASALVLVGPLPASARWTIHNDADVTQMTAPPGGDDRQTCGDSLRGQSGWAVFNPDTTSVTVPDYAFEAVPYVVYVAAVGSLPGGDFVTSPDGTDTIVYSDANGFESASVLLNFNTKPRSLLAAPEAVSGVDGEFVYTSGDLSTTFPSRLAVGSIIGVKPANGGSVVHCFDRRRLHITSGDSED